MEGLDATVAREYGAAKCWQLEEGSMPQCAGMRACSGAPRGRSVVRVRMLPRARPSRPAVWHGPACAGGRRASVAQSRDFLSKRDVEGGWHGCQCFSLVGSNVRHERRPAAGAAGWWTSARWRG